MAASVSELLYNTFIEPREKKACDKPVAFEDPLLRHEGDVRNTQAETIVDSRKSEKEPSPRFLFEFSAEERGTVENKEKPAEKKAADEKNEKHAEKRGAVEEEEKASAVREALRLGIRLGVGAMAESPGRDVLMKDFMAVETTALGAALGFKSYAPEAFRHLRHLFGVPPAAFVASLCDADLLALPGAGASGALLLRTGDGRFVVKTVARAEARFLQRLLPGYYLNLHQNPRTLLPRFFGLYRCRRGPRGARAVVSNNVLPAGVRTRFDLKGSTRGRLASEREREKDSPTLKDLDFVKRYPEGLFLAKDVYEALVGTIRRDCRVLESFQIMDYSLLLGVHEPGFGPADEGRGGEKGRAEEEEAANGDGQRDKDRGRGASLFDEAGALEGLPAKLAGGEELTLFVGIIDILQSYGPRKRLEHAVKSLVHGGGSVSVQNPAFYSQRFQEFVTGRVFKEWPTRRSRSGKHEEKKKDAGEEVKC